MMGGEDENEANEDIRLRFFIPSWFWVLFFQKFAAHFTFPMVLYVPIQYVLPRPSLLASVLQIVGNHRMKTHLKFQGLLRLPNEKERSYLLSKSNPNQKKGGKDGQDSIRLDQSQERCQLHGPGRGDDVMIIFEVNKLGKGTAQPAGDSQRNESKLPELAFVPKLLSINALSHKSWTSCHNQICDMRFWCTSVAAKHRSQSKMGADATHHIADATHHIAPLHPAAV